MPAALNDRQVEELTQKLGHEMFERMRGSNPRMWQYAWWQERLLRLCMQDEWFKVQAFRFIDVLPMMGTDVELARHLKEYFVLPARGQEGTKARRHGGTKGGDGDAAKEWVGRAGHVHSGYDGRQHDPAADEREAALHELDAVPATRRMVEWVSRLMDFRRLDGPRARLLALAARKSSMIMAGSFIAGSNVDEAVRAIRRLRGRRMAFTIDVLGEAALSTTEGEAYQQVYLDLIEALPGHAARWPAVPLVDEGDGQAIPRVKEPREVLARVRLEPLAGPVQARH